MHYLYLKGYSAKTAMNEIHDIYNTDYPSYATAKRIFQSFALPALEESENERRKSPKIQERIDAIQPLILNDSQISVRSIADQTQIPVTSVWRTLISDLGLTYRYPTLAPHVLTPEIKGKRVERSIQLLKVLEAPTLKLENIVTGDESWLDWTGKIPGRWQREDEPPPFSPRKSQTIKKTMLIVFFSFTQILVKDFLPNGIRNNSEYMCEHIWSVIEQKYRQHRPKTGAKGVFLHFDNSPIHKSKESMEKINDLGFIVLENPPYSPDIAPSDFWLFGFLDEKRKGTEASNENQLISQTNEILNQIDKTVLGTVFQEWIRRLHIVIDSGGEYLLN